MAIKITSTGDVYKDGVLQYNLGDVDEALASKADVSYVNTEVANKQDILVANDPAVKTALNATGTAPIYACRAWVNFNGTGTVAIRASGNVSSITDNGVGNYTVNFTTAMPDVNYNAVYGVAIRDDTLSVIQESTGSHLLNSVTFKTNFKEITTSSGGLQDAEIVSVSIFR